MQLSKPFSSHRASGQLEIAKFIATFRYFSHTDEPTHRATAIRAEGKVVFEIVVFRLKARLTVLHILVESIM
eukprot:scaffold31409_cov18-Prasinocladus_malaysianus.AAC.1